jgi:alpha-L-rhamnosidase
MLSEVARAIGENADADTYAALSDDVRAAFTAAFVAADGTLSGGSQTAYALALGMVPPPCGSAGTPSTPTAASAIPA